MKSIKTDHLLQMCLFAALVGVDLVFQQVICDYHSRLADSAVSLMLVVLAKWIVIPSQT